MDEMKTAALPDKRLDERLRQVLSQLAARPTASIPAACGGRTEMVAAYRFFENENTGFDNVLQPHRDATRQRMAAQPTVVLAQDTTEINVTRPEQQVAGAGPLDGDSRRGALLHLVHAFTPDGTPLGTVQGTAWTREEGTVCASLSRAQRAAMPIEEKESHRWVVGLRQAAEEARHCPSTRFILAADSESDIYEVLVEGMAETNRCDWIVRACQDRALLCECGENKAETHLRDYLTTQSELFRKTIPVRGRKAKVGCETRGRRQPRQSREAEVAVRAARVTLRPPWRGDRRLPPVTVNVVWVCEVNPPPGDEPVEWLLLTSLPVDDIEQVREVIQYYCVRWMIEVFFRVLKSGCLVEDRLFEYMDRLLTCLGVYVIVAWRTLYVCRLGRSCPEMDCEVVFEPSEWKSVWKVVKRTEPPLRPPALGMFVRLVARLGGYVDRQRAAPPGPQTLWIGLQRMHDFATCWQLFGPDATNETLTCVEQRGHRPGE
jgi:Transposase Tn5 dimerisation domain/Transposase DNA-binding